MGIGKRVVETALGPVVLHDDEILLSVEPNQLRLPALRVNPHQALLRAGRVDNASSLGTNGLLASISNPENSDNPEVRRYERTWVRDASEAIKGLRKIEMSEGNALNIFSYQVAYDLVPENFTRFALAYISDESDESKLAEPGKIANHLRPQDDPLAIQLTRETGRGWPWYGSSDATPKTVELASMALEQNPGLAGELLFHPVDGLRPLEPVVFSDKQLSYGGAVAEAIGWMLHTLKVGHGLAWAGLNKKDSFTVWRDAPNTYCHSNGFLASVPVAPLSLQIDFYNALEAASRLSDGVLPRRAVRGFDISPSALSFFAEHLKQMIISEFVASDERGGFLVDALDLSHGKKRQLQVPAIDMGKALDSTVLAENRDLASSIIARFASPEFLTPFGLRGRAATDPRYTDQDYQCRVWFKATAEAARGMMRHGYVALGTEILARCMRQTADGLIPENVIGSNVPRVDYGNRIVTVKRVNYDGKWRSSVKERPSHPFQTWSIGNAIFADQIAQQKDVDFSPKSEKELDLLSSLTEHAFDGPSSLTFSQSGNGLTQFKSASIEHGIGR